MPKYVKDVTTSRGQTNAPMAEQDVEKEDAPRNKKLKELSVRVVDMEDEFKERIDSDQTGRFPFRPSRGYQYVMVVAESDDNTIMYV